MSEAILIALITGGLALIGTYMTVRSGNEKMMQEIRTHSAVQDEKLDALTKKVEKHNNLVERMYKVEAKLASLDK